MEKREFRMMMCLALATILLINFTSAYDHIIRINETELPYTGALIIMIEGFNETVEVEYGGFLSGVESINFTNRTNKTLTADVFVPFDVDEYDYTSYINLSNNESYPVQFQIIDDVYFDLISDDICFKGSVQEIIPEAPLNSTINISINDDKISWSGEPIISYIPQYTGDYQIIADFSYRDNIEQIRKNFTVYDMLSCTLTSDDTVNYNESITFSAKITGGVGDIEYSWDFDDGSKSAAETPDHLYSEPDDYKVTLQVSDELGYESSCSKLISVEEPLYDLVIILSDNMTGKPIGDANVTINDSLKKSNVDGKAKFFDIAAGEYELNIIRKDYENYSRDISIRSDSKIYINMSIIPEEKRPVPEIDITYPDDGHITDNDHINFEFRVSSATSMDYCYLLFNDISNLGYKIKGEIISPENARDYSFYLDLTNGEFKWKIQCENKDGIGESDERYLTVRGVKTIDEPVEDKTEEATDKAPSDFSVDVSEFSQALLEISDFNKKIIASSKSVRDVFDVLNLQAALDEYSSDIKRLKQEMIDLQGLAISDTDKKRKKSEILAEFKKISSKIPKDIIIVDEAMYDIDTENNNITRAIDEYLAWKDYELTDREYKKYESKVKEAQKELGVHTIIRNAQIEYVSGDKRDFGIISKEVYTEPLQGSIFLEMIPKSVAETISSIVFSFNIEVVNNDPVIRIYTDENREFSYYVQKKIDIEELRAAGSVLVLDLNHPQNKITGFSILDTDNGIGKFFFVLILLFAVITANYFIFFREKEVREKIGQNLKNAKNNLKVKSAEEKLMMLLDKIVDQLNTDETESALSKYSTAIELYERTDPKLQLELRPIIEHLFFELEVFNINKMISSAYNKTISGRWYEAVETYNEIKDSLTYIPDRFSVKIDKKFVKLNLSMDIHMMRSHNTSSARESNVDDSLYGGRE